jgi:hypothetical protein
MASIRAGSSVSSLVAGASHGCVLRPVPVLAVEAGPAAGPVSTTAGPAGLGMPASADVVSALEVMKGAKRKLALVGQLGRWSATMR